MLSSIETVFVNLPPKVLSAKPAFSLLFSLFNSSFLLKRIKVWLEVTRLNVEDLVPSST